MHPTGRQMKKGKKISVSESSGTGWPLRHPLEGLLVHRVASPAVVHVLHNFSQAGKAGATNQVALKHLFEKRSVSCSSPIYLYPSKPLIEVYGHCGVCLPAIFWFLGELVPHPLWSRWGCHTWQDGPGRALLRCSLRRDPSFQTPFCAAAIRKGASKGNDALAEAGYRHMKGLKKGNSRLRSEGLTISGIASLQGLCLRLVASCLQDGC